MINTINVADIVNTESGKTFREENNEKTHNIPLGTLVEVSFGDSNDESKNGLRLFVVSHNRDCDGTPLYGLSFRKDWKIDLYGPDYEMLTKAMVDYGYSEKCLKVIKKK
jgi:hypothetical protein